MGRKACEIEGTVTLEWFEGEGLLAQRGIKIVFRETNLGAEHVIVMGAEDWVRASCGHGRALALLRPAGRRKAARGHLRPAGGAA